MGNFSSEGRGHRIADIHTGCIAMSGEARNQLFGGANCVAKAAYLNGGDHAMAPPIELIQFISEDGVKDTPDLRKTFISEIRFRVNDIDAVYQDLTRRTICPIW